MKIKDLRNGRKDTVTYKNWKDEYIDKGTYSNYEITEYFNVVEIHRLKSDGTRSMTFMEKTQADEIKRQFPNEFEIKQLTFKGYNKWLVKESQLLKMSFWNYFRYKLLQYITPKKKPKLISEQHILNIKTYRNGFLGLIIAFAMLILAIITFISYCMVEGITLKELFNYITG